MKNPFVIADQQARIRLIPQLDKMPRAIDFVCTFYGKLAILLFNLVLLWSFLIKIPLSLIALSAFLVLIPIAANWKFVGSLAWVSLFGLGDTEFGIWNFGELNRAHINSEISKLYALAGEHLFLYRFFILFGSGCLFYALAFGIKKLCPRWPALWFLGLWATLLFLADAIPRETLGSVYAWGLFSIVGRCLVGAMYLQLALKSVPHLTELTKFIFPLQGALLSTGNNFLKTPLLLKKSVSKKIEETRRNTAICLLKSAKLLLWTRILTFVADIINSVAYGRFYFWLPKWASNNFLDWNDPYIIGFREYNELDLPLLQSWGAVVLHTINFMFLLCTLSGVTISFIRMSGIYIPRDTCRPYAAKSFNDFLRRTLFYYSEILVNIFIYPIWKNSRFFVRYRKLRLSLTLLVTVGFFGWITHIIFMPGYFVLSGGAKNGFFFFLFWIPYFTLLAMASAISATGFFKKILDPIFPSVVQMPLIFLFYSLLLTTAHSYPLTGGILENWHTRLIFICSLFALN